MVDGLWSSGRTTPSVKALPRKIVQLIERRITQLSALRTIELEGEIGEQAVYNDLKAPAERAFVQVRMAIVAIAH
jgi:hypothetical protein